MRLCTLVNLTYFARLVLKGESYGLNDKLTHEKEEPMVEFFFNPKPGDLMSNPPYFVSRYYISTFLSIKGGLLLDTDIKIPNLSAEDVKTVQEFILNFCPDAKKYS